MLRIETTSSLFTRPPKRTSEFSNRTCVFIGSTFLSLSLNKRFEATLTHDIHWIESVYSKIKESITENIETNHFKNWLKLKYLLLCTWRYLSLESFTLSKLFQFNPWVDNRAMCMFKVLCILDDIELPVYQNAHVNSVCEKVYSSRRLFYFQCSTVKIYKYKGKYLLRRIPYASHGSFNSFVISRNKHTLSMVNNSCVTLRYVFLPHKWWQSILC